MIRDFSKDELEATESGQDTELTLEAVHSSFSVAGCWFSARSVSASGTSLAIGTSQASETTSSPFGRAKPISVPTGSGSKPGAAGQPPARPQARCAGRCRHRVFRKRQTADRCSSRCRGRRIRCASQAQVKPALDSQVHPASTAANQRCAIRFRAPGAAGDDAGPGLDGADCRGLASRGCGGAYECAAQARLHGHRSS